MSDKYTFVTVACVQDLGFMHLQARSMNRYVNRDLVKEIIVIENGPPKLPDGWRERLRKEYGTLRDYVKFVPAEVIAHIPPNTAGWFSQQVLKLMVAKIVRSKGYLILDAKNHLIFPLTSAHIERNGKPRSFVYGYLNHPLRRYLDPILKYFDLAANHNERFLPTTTPFYADVALVNQMMRSMIAREKGSFEDIFIKSKIRFTEFFLIGAHILSTKHRFEDFYDLSGEGYSIIWREIAANDTVITREIASSERRQAPFFSVHRTAFPLLTEASKRSIAQFWQRRGLFGTESDGLRYLANPNTL